MELTQKVLSRWVLGVCLYRTDIANVVAGDVAPVSRVPKNKGHPIVCTATVGCSLFLALVTGARQHGC